MSDPKETAARTVKDASKNTDKTPDRKPADTGNDNFRLLADIPVRLSVEVGSVSKRLADIMAFREGEVVELDRQSDALLDIKVNGTLVAKGEVVTVDGRFGVRIAELTDTGAGFPAIERR